MNCNEECWMITGKIDKKLWHGHLERMSSGDPVSVAFDADDVIKRDEILHDLVGFCHTHPTFIAYPSSRDIKTMGAWVNCLGKSLLCLIKGTDGLRGYWFDDDGGEFTECQAIQVEHMVFGTTEIIEEEEQNQQSLVSLIAKHWELSNNNEARRMIEAGAIFVNSIQVKDSKAVISITDGTTIRKGYKETLQWRSDLGKWIDIGEE